MTYFLGVFTGGGVVQIDIWSQTLLKNYILYSKFVLTQTVKWSQPNVDRRINTRGGEGFPNSITVREGKIRHFSGGNFFTWWLELEV